jgi:hypothetical protein
MSNVFNDQVLFNNGTQTFGNASVSGNLEVAGTIRGGFIELPPGEAFSLDETLRSGNTSGIGLSVGISTINSLQSTGISVGVATVNSLQSTGISVGVATVNSAIINNQLRVSGVSTFSSSGIGTVTVGIGTTALLVDGSARVTGILTASQYRFSTQGFDFELKDGILTPLNKTKATFVYTGSNQTLTVPSTGIGSTTWIYVKLWGAGGGAGRAGGWSYGADGGGGGHTRGLFPVTPGSTITIVIGRGGTVVNGTTQGYGGGGTNGTAGDNSYGGHGGGYCGIFTSSTLNQANAIAIAGGGGGGGSSRTWFGNIGGAGGGLVGQRGSSPYDGKFTAGGNAGTQSAGGSATSGYGANGSAGSALQGGAGASASYGGGGGGGYYGGGGGGYSETNTMAGGGGGSGYVRPDGLLTGTYTGEYRNVAYSQDPDLLTTTSDITCPGFGGQNTQNNQAVGAQSGGHAYAVIYY